MPSSQQRGVDPVNCHHPQLNDGQPFRPPGKVQRAPFFSPPEGAVSMATVGGGEALGPAARQPGELADCQGAVYAAVSSWGSRELRGNRTRFLGPRRAPTAGRGDMGSFPTPFPLVQIPAGRRRI